jgi:hypothetical protein
MPPAKAVAEGKVKPLSDEDARTIVRWIDLGCPIDLDYDPQNPRARGYGWMLDDNRPILTLNEPRPGVNARFSRIMIGMHDYYTGLDMGSFRVTADFALGDIPAGQNLASRFQMKSPGVWEWTLPQPLRELSTGTLTVSVKDKEGNVTRTARTFSIRSVSEEH